MIGLLFVAFRPVFVVAAVYTTATWALSTGLWLGDRITP